VDCGANVTVPLGQNVKQCLRCGEQVPRGSNYRTKKYCCRPCYHAHRHSEEKQLENFWARIDKNAPNGCWVYKGFRNRDGYGGINLLGHYLAHRLTWTLAKGPIPEGMHALHTCHNPPCCNPDHLYLGADLENARDRREAGRHATILSPDDVREIRRLIGTMQQKDIAEKYGVCPTAITAIKTGRTWKHIQ
jgi:hypothetical protein